MTDLLIQNIGQIVSPRPGVTRGSELRNLTIIENGVIYVKEGLIQAVGSPDEVLPQIDERPQVLDAKDRAVIPGFVDSHTHLVFGGNRADEFAMRSAGMSYEKIAAQGGGIISTVEATRNTPKEELKYLALNRLRRALEQGITSMEIKSGYGLNLETERKMLEVIHELKDEQPIELTATFLGAHAVPKEKSKEKYIEEVLAMIPEIAALADYCDVFCEEGYFTPAESRQILEKGLEYGLPPRVHTNQFHDIGGVEMALDIGAIAVEHLEALTVESIEKIARSETTATVLPGVSHFLGIPYAPARQLIDKGALVNIATDFNPGSSMTLSMQLMMNFACTQMGLSVEEALCCVTQNAARALEKMNVGCIATGYQADLLVLDTDDFRNVAYFFGQNHVRTVVKKGEVVFG
ncbi:MAG: imidazolonepropionase [Candidatus Marinimicrobia bacterium]|nr:imidazolonepropionase [Candidatus Neomarinimicrobiota bacterium]MCF7829407.1 imidazolonepropionase [Candidatus Neomarinimicrobiota bacterium]MCF7880893.1 imidazolonepropionase [Candidatus Neomarinimicrobiota bacterium]